MAPRIYNRWDKLKDKLLDIDKTDVEERWIEARKNNQPLILAPSPPPSPTINDSPAKSSRTKPRKPIVKIRPKNAAHRSDESSRHVAPRSNASSKQVVYEADELFTHSAISDEPSTSKSIFRTDSNSQEKQKGYHNPSPDSPVLSQSSNQPSSESDAICRGTVDQLVVNEQYDEYRFDDDDFVTDTQLHKTLKKIRSDPLPHKEQPVRPPTPTPKAAPAPAPPTPPKSVAAAHQPPVDPTPRTPAKRKEPDWNETARQLQTNQFHNVYKDLEYFKDRILSDNKAKSLVLEAVIKCVQEDETNPLSDLLTLIYNLDFFKDDKDFWSELLLRLKRKIQPNSLYKTKSCPNTVRANYRRVLEGILEYAKSANLKLTLNFNDMTYFVTHSTQHSQPALASSKVEPDVKSEVKQDRQENVDPSIVRRVTLIKDANGKPSFKIVRPLNVSASKPLKRIKM